MQELLANAPVEPHAACDVLHVGTKLVAQVRDLVDECDLGREKGVGRVLGEFGRLETSHHHRRFHEEQWTVQLAQDRLGARRFASDHHAIGTHEVADRRALTQELRVRCHINVGLGVGVANQLRHPPPGAHGDRALRDHDGVAAQRLGHINCGLLDKPEIGVPIAAAAWRAYREKHGVRPAHGGWQIGREAQTTRPHTAGHQIIQTGFEDRDVPATQAFDLAGIPVHTRDRGPELGETRTRYESNVSGADHGDVHGVRGGSWQEQSCPTGAHHSQRWCSGQRDADTLCPLRAQSVKGE